MGAKARKIKINRSLEEKKTSYAANSMNGRNSHYLMKTHCFLGGFGVQPPQPPSYGPPEPQPSEYKSQEPMSRQSRVPIGSPQGYVTDA